MIFSQIASHNPNKTAIVNNGREYSFLELKNLIVGTSGQFLKENAETFIFNSDNAVENLIGLLACNFVGKVGIIASNKLPKSELEELLLSENASLFKGEISSADTKILVTDTTKGKLFLGVLSSGSLGKPKVIYKDYYCWLSAFKHQSIEFKISKDSKVFCVDALAYSANLNAVLHALWAGATVVLSTIQSIKKWTSIHERYEIDTAFMVPSHLKTWSEVSKVGLNNIITAGEKLPLKLAKELLDEYKGLNLIEYYGTAELGHISIQKNKEILNTKGSVGRPFPGVKIIIKEGLIYVDSPYVSPQFKENPTSLDYGRLEKGQLILLGRAGRMFNRRGLNIFAEEIENKVLGLEAVQKVALMQLESNLVLTFSSTNSSYIDKVKTFIQAEIEPSKWPNGYKQIESFPILNSGKINFKELQKILDAEAVLV